MRFALLCLAPLILGGGSSIAVAQRLPIGTLGTRVRITLGRSTRYTGTLISLSADSLAVAGSPKDTFRISRQSLAQFEISRGRRPNTSRGALYGLVSGTVIGAGLGAIHGFDTGDYVETGAAGAIGGVVLGTLLGAAIRTERWEAAELEGPGPEPLIAELPSAQPSGTRVRVSAPAVGVRKLTGSLVAADIDSLFIRGSGGVTTGVPRSAVTQIWFSDGHRANTAKGALFGFITGAVVGGAWALSVRSDNDGDCGESGCGVLALLPLATAGGGLAAGALLGSFVETERWKPGSPTDLRLTLRAGVDAGTRIRLLLSYAF